MYSQNLILSAENPRLLAFQQPLPFSSSATAKPMSNEIAQKPPPSILVGRFKALLKQREDELRVGGGHVPPPSTEEIVQLYELLLSELTCNLKPIITDLTIIAEQQREHAKGIADVICARILEVCLGFRGKFLSFFPFCSRKFCKNTILDSDRSYCYIWVKVSVFATSNFRSWVLILWIFFYLLVFGSDNVRRERILVLRFLLLGLIRKRKCHSETERTSGLC